MNTFTHSHTSSGTWVYHYYDLEDDHDDDDDEGNTTHLVHVDIHSFTGEIEFTILGEEPPVRIAPPYGVAGDGESDRASVCGAEPGER